MSHALSQQSNPGEDSLDPRPFAVRHFSLVVACAALALLALVVLHISVGTVDLTPREVLLGLIGAEEQPWHRQIIWELRLPRALVALTAGGMLGLAGALLQSITRNPLAEPGLLGISSGAVLFIVIYIVSSAGGNLRSMPDTGLILPAMGIVGGLGTGLLVYLLSYERGLGARIDPMRLVLVGVLVAGINSALISLILLSARAEDIQRIVAWTIGSTNGRVWAHWGTIWPVAIVAIPLGCLSVGLVNALQLGENVARSLGVRLEPARFLLLAIAAMLTAGSVAVVGAVGFIGLIGPHAARLAAWNNARRLLPLSILFTAGLLIASDIVARVFTLDWLGQMVGLDIPAGTSLPVGAITALLGAPFFLYLLLRGRVSL